MVYRRKRTFRRRPVVKRKRTYRKRSSTSKGGYLKVIRWSSQDGTNNCHTTITGSDAVPTTDGAALFALNNVNGAGEIVSLFDNFRITKVLYRWVITRTPDQVTTAGNKGLFPRIVWTHDFNDSTLINRTLIYQRSNLKEVYMSDNFQKTKWYSLSPAILTQMYESTVNNAYQPTWKKWIDTSDQATPHFGIKYNVDQNFTGMTVRLEAKLFIECKGIS